MDQLICPHCEQPVKRVLCILTKVDFWNWDGKGFPLSSPTDDLGEPYNRAGFEPEYTGTIYLCTLCYFTLPYDEVDKLVYLPPFKSR